MAHFSVASLFQIGLLFVFICWTKESTGAALSLEEEFKQLKDNYIQMQEIVKNLESKDIQMRDKVTNLESKVTELEAKDFQMQIKVAKQDLLLSDLLREKNESPVAANYLEFAPMRSNESAVAINGLPSSCGDLKLIGHTLNGFYSIVGATMMESVYCDFSKLPSDPNFQKWIGFTDVKSAPVHFYVQRESSFSSTTGTPIPFQLAVVNEGNAMDLTSGKFTAPRPGIYFFSFTGMAKFPTASSDVWLGVSIHLNGVRIALGYVDERNTVADQLSPLTVQSTLNLKSGDQVWVAMVYWSAGAYLYDYSDHWTHFTGFMLEEEIVASL